MEVRSATIDDLDAVVEVKVAAIRPVYEPIGSDELTGDHDVAEQTAWLGHVLRTIGSAPFLVAVDATGRILGATGRILGWIRLDGEGDGTSAEIRGLFVDPSAQASGIGRALVREGSRRMRELGFRSLKVQTLAGSRACTFYERVGGVHAGEVPFRAHLTESVFRWSDIAVAAEQSG